MSTILAFMQLRKENSLDRDRKIFAKLKCNAEYNSMRNKCRELRQSMENLQGTPQHNVAKTLYLQELNKFHKFCDQAFDV